MKSLIQTLTEISGPCGYETLVRARVRREVEAYADELHVDGLGNLIVRKGELRPGGKRILLLANMDEPGLMVSHVRQDRLARFMTLGNLRAEVLAGARVRFLDGAAGVVGYPSSKPEKKALELDQIFIDAGAGEPPVKPGDVAVLEAPFLDLGERIVAKALDNRVGVAILIETLRRLDQNQAASPHQIHFVFSVQEVEGSRGAGAAAFQVEPELALALACTHSHAGPGAPAGAVKLGAGAVIRLRDASLFSPTYLVDHMLQSAEAGSIPHQVEVLTHETTGARVAQITNSGAAAGVIAVPCRYRGGPAEMVDLKDVQAASDLLLRLLTQPIEG